MKYLASGAVTAMLMFAVSACGPRGVAITPGGDVGTMSGAAGGAQAVDSTVNRCARNVGTVAISDGRSQAWYSMFQSRTGVPSVEPILSLLAQQSNCFEIVSLGNQGVMADVNAMMSEMRGSGEYRAESNLQKGQRKAADYILVPQVLYAGAQDNTVSSGVGSMVGDMFLGGLGSIAGAAYGTRSATNVTLQVYDVRVGTVVAQAQGSATASALGAFGQQIGIGDPRLQAYSSTADGKATAAAFYDAFNKLAVAISNYRPQDFDGTGGTGGRLITN